LIQSLEEDRRPERVIFLGTKGSWFPGRLEAGRRRKTIFAVYLREVLTLRGEKMKKKELRRKH